jgi:hypothetical protein
MSAGTCKAAVAALCFLQSLASPAAAGTAGPRNQAVPLSEYQTVRYVSAAGSDRSGDGTKAKPWATLPHALSQAGAAGPSARVAVLVATGVYRGQTIQLKPFVDLFGGYDPAGWVRDPSRFPSVLDGENQRRIAFGADHARLDGFTLRRGRVRGKGGAILCDGTSPVISNNTFLENRTSAPEPWNPPILHETANDGGAIAVLNGAAPAIESNVFARNRTENGRGGAIACDHEASPRIVANVIVQNLTGINDPMRSSDGGGLSIYDHSHPLVSGNVIAANRTLNGNDAGGIFVALWSAPRIENNFIVGNASSDDAGGLFVSGQKHHYGTPLDPVPPPASFLVRLTGNTIIGNENPSHNSGAARIAMQSRAELRNNVIARNEAGLYLQTSAVDARNNTVADDLLVLNDSKATHELPGPTSLVNNIFWGKADVRMEAGISHSDFRAGAPGKSNIDNDPMFLTDGWSGPAALVERNSDGGWTSFKISGLPNDPSIAERAIRIGNFWTVVRSAGSGALTVWGDLPQEFGDGTVRVEIVQSYRLRPGSPCLGAGENGSNIGVQK